MDILNNLPEIAGNFSFLLIFAAISLGVGFFFGRTRLISLMIDVYIARALVAVVPSAWITIMPYGNVIVFLLAFIFLFLIDHRLFDLHTPSRSRGFFGRVIVMGALTTGMIVSSLLTYLPEELVGKYISQTITSYFTTGLAPVLWMTLPILALLFINRRRD